MDSFLDLIRISLSTRYTFTHTLSDEEWEEVYCLSLKQSIAGVLFEGIQKIDEKYRPNKTLILKWYVTAENIKKRNVLLNQKATELTQLFEYQDFRSCILKGQGLATLYPIPESRTSGDIDVWLDGTRNDVLKYVRNKFPNVEVVYHHVEFPIFHNVSVEVHFTPSRMFSYFKNRRLQNFFREQSERQFVHEIKPFSDNEKICVPTVEFNLVYVLEHIYRHLFQEGIGLRQLMDYYYVLLQPKDKKIDASTLKVLKELGMLKFAAAVMFIMKAVFGMDDKYLLCEPNEKEGKFLMNEVLRAGNFGKYDDRNIVTKNRLLKLLLSMKRNARFLTHYPSEVIWAPCFKVWHFLWRLQHGFLGIK